MTRKPRKIAILKKPIKPEERRIKESITLYDGICLREIIDKVETVFDKYNVLPEDIEFRLYHEHSYDDDFCVASLEYSRSETDQEYNRRYTEYEKRLKRYDKWYEKNREAIEETKALKEKERIAYEEKLLKHELKQMEKEQKRMEKRRKDIEKKLLVQKDES